MWASEDLRVAFSHRVSKHLRYPLLRETSTTGESFVILYRLERAYRAWCRDKGALPTVDIRAEYERGRGCATTDAERDVDINKEEGATDA